jgi:hypothetical protein
LDLSVEAGGGEGSAADREPAEREAGKRMMEATQMESMSLVYLPLRP